MLLPNTTFSGGNNETLTEKILKLDYPYKKYSMEIENVLSRFHRLKEYRPPLVKRRANIFSLPRGTPEKYIKFDNMYLYILVKEEDYDLYDNISDYFQEQERVKCKRFDQKISSYEYWQQNKIDIIKKVDELTIHNVREELYKLWYECTSFRPSLFVGFWKIFSKERSIKKVLDISMGWGDRLIGALATDIELYVGTDPNTKLFDGYKRIIEAFNGKNKAICINSGFENANVEEYGPYDLVFSSPPYFNLETYSDEITQSTHNRDLEAWYKEWLIPSLKKALNNLFTGGIMIININNIRGYTDYTIRMVKEISGHGVKYRGCIPQWSGIKNKSAQPFWIFEKI
jgi:16S rRNA G966 N2-methylase RsmD